MSEETCLEFTTIEISRLRELEAENKQLRARAERAEEQAEECAAQFRRLWGAIVKVHKILFSARTCGKGKYGGKYHLAALDAENLLFDVMEGGEA